MVSSVLADFCARFNVGLKSRVNRIFIPYSKLNLRLLILLMRLGCISTFFVDSDKKTGLLLVTVTLKFLLGRPVIEKVDLISKPGLRVYWTLGELAKKFDRNTFNGFYILSTSEGLCISSELLTARTLVRKVSGEVVLKVIF